MNDASTKAKRRGAARRLTQSTWRLVAFPLYRIGLAGANAFLPFLPVALEGGDHGAGSISSLTKLRALRLSIV